MKIKNMTKMPRLMMEWKEQFMNFPLTTTQFDNSLGSPAGRGNHSHASLGGLSFFNLFKCIIDIQCSD